MYTSKEGKLISERVMRKVWALSFPFLESLAFLISSVVGTEGENLPTIPGTRFNEGVRQAAALPDTPNLEGNHLLVVV